jgi:quercetin dioxygenase-like cupin family protein
MPNLIDPNKVNIVDTKSIPWEELTKENGQKMYDKNLNGKGGMLINMSRYPAGFRTPWHVHKCNHGIYVLEGNLYTSVGCFGPGHFAWFPAGVIAEHGATPDGDVTVLFITDREFDITFVDQK